MHPGRVDVIGGGALVLDRVMRRFGFAEVLVSEHDILDGIAWSLATPGRDGRLAEPSPARALRVPPGSGWPDDPATAAARRSPATPRRSASSRPARAPGRAGGAAVGLPGLPAAGRLARAGGRGQAPLACGRARTGAGRCPAGATSRPRVLILGLAPAAHGGNRTGRIFTGDRSGDVLFASLYRCGLAAAAGRASRRATASGCSARGWPPRSAARRRRTSRPWPSATPARPGCPQNSTWWPRRCGSSSASGGFAWQALWPLLRRRPGIAVPRPRPGFGHGAEVWLAGPGGPDAGDRLLPPKPAEHVHRPGHPRHAG